MLGLGGQPGRKTRSIPSPMSASDGDADRGIEDYVLHFDQDEIASQGAFWSVTMYDEQGFQVANELNRFAIGDRDPLHFNPDGSLDLYIQHASPGAARESDWLPAPNGRLGITMRLYAPERARACR